MKEDTSISGSTGTMGAGKNNGKWVSKDAGKSADSSKSLDLDSMPAQVMEKARTAYDSVVENAGTAFSTASTRTSGWVKQYPMQTALGALAIGFLLGAAVSRRGVKVS